MLIKPKGIYSSSGATNSVVLKHKSCRGVLIRAKWADVEPTDGVFNFTDIDSQIAVVKSYGKKYSLGILAGSFTPSWVYSNTTVKTFNCVLQGSTKTIPTWWDTKVTDKLKTLSDALGAKYGSDTSLSLVYVPQMTNNGIEGHYNGVSSTTLSSSGYTSSSFADAAKQTANDFKSAFPSTPVAIEYHSILNSNDHATKMMTDLTGVGATMWWINGDTKYQSSLLDIFTTYAGDKYAQLLDKSVNQFSPNSFPNTYKAVFSQAKQLGIRYIEPWDYEFTTAGDSWQSVFDDYNSWADTNFA